MAPPDADRNWDSTRRMRDLEADGIVAEVIYPNTVPPFFPKGGLTSLAPQPEEFAQRDNERQLIEVGRQDNIRVVRRKPGGEWVEVSRARSTGPTSPPPSRSWSTAPGAPAS